MAAGFNTVNINGMSFRDATDVTCNALHIMSYEEAYAYSLGYVPRHSTTTSWSQSKEENKEKNRENS